MVRPASRGSVSGPADEETLVQVFRREYEPLMRLAYVLTGNQHESEELVQDAFVDLQHRWNRVLNPAGYLRTVVANGARRRGRKRSNRRRIMEQHQDAVARDTTDRPLYDLYLTDALARLPDRHRIAIVLAYFGGFTSTEIAETLRCRPATARSLVHRGLRLLARELDHE